MTLKRWTYGGTATLGESDWRWAMVADETPTAEQREILAKANNPGARDSYLRGQHWADAELADLWIEDQRRTAPRADVIETLLPAQQAAEVVQTWYRLSNALRALNVPPYALAVYRQAWEARVGEPTWTDPFGYSAPWRDAADHAAGSPPRGYPDQGCTIFGTPGSGRDRYRLWLRADGRLDLEHFHGPDPDATPAWENNSDDNVFWNRTEWTWSDERGVCFIADSTTLFAGSPLHEYWSLAVEILEWMRGVGPLGVIWAAHLGATARNVATLKAAGLPTSDLARLSGLREELVDQARQASLDNVARGLHTATGVIAGLTSEKLAKAIVGAFGDVAEAGYRLLNALGGTAVARFEDVFGRAWPVLETAEITNTEEGARQLQPPFPGALGILGGVISPGVTQIRQDQLPCGGPGYPECQKSTVPGNLIGTQGWIMLGLAGAGVVGGAYWLRWHRSRRRSKE